MPTQPTFRRWWLSITLAACLASATVLAGEAPPPDPASTRAQVQALLTNFLTPAVNETAAGHDRFWADDLVYTSSNGQVLRKADIMKSLADAPKPAAGKKPEPGPVFTAEDILVRPYGNVAALTFRLVAHEPGGKVSYYRNSGTFVWRGGKWQAVTWQATRVEEKGK